MTLVICLYFPAQNVHSWKSKNSSPSTSSPAKVKKLGKTQRKILVDRVVRKFVSQSFFTTAELPRKVTLSTLVVEGDDVALTGKQFTNMVLNNVLQDPSILVVNQDLKMDYSLDYKLMNYYSAIQARKQGIVLGANYYISGSIKTNHKMKKSGSLERHYVAELEVRKIRSNELVASATYDYKKGQIRRKR